jgi:hypothetical protein
VSNLRTDDYRSTTDRMPPEARQRGLAQAQAVIREVNEQIHQLNGRFGDLDLRTVVCECSQPDCMTQIEIAPDAYERVRAFPTRFIVIPGHETPSVERVVETHDGYVIAETYGIGAETAIRLDPRRRPSRPA